MPSYFGRTPSIGNSQSIVAGARVGWRVQVNEAPVTSVTITTQAHLDALNAAVDAPKPIEAATRNKVNNTPAFREAVINTLAKIKVEAETPGSQVNSWLRKTKK